MHQAWPWWRFALIGLIALALSLSIYMSWHHLIGGPVIGCSGGGSCDRVLSSNWSTIGGVLPVSGLAVGVYLAMLVACFYIGPAIEASVRRLAWGVMLVLAGSVAGSAVWFTVLQKRFIGTFCPYCMTAHIVGLLIAALVIWRAPMQRDVNVADDSSTNTTQVKDVPPATSRRLIDRLQAIGLPLVGLTLSVIVAICQVVITPSAVYRDGISQDIESTIDPHNVPLVGSPDAPYVVNLLFDYQCSHCQQMHFMLDEAIRRYDGKLAFVLCPAPLSSKCNPYIPQDADEFNNSCELAKVAMAVWVADRESFAVFNRWMFLMDSGDYWLPRSLDAARSKAVELIGQVDYDDAFNNPWIDQYIQTIIQTYAQTGNAVPKLVYGSRWIIPELYSVDDLVTILQNNLAVPTP